MHVGSDRDHATIAPCAAVYQGQSAFSLGLSRVLDDGRTIFKAGMTYDTQQRVGANAGFGIQFGSVPASVAIYPRRLQ